MTIDIDVYLFRQGYRAVLPDITVEQIIVECGSNHSDGTQHEYEPALTENGLIDKCTFCGDEQEYNHEKDDDEE